MKKLGWALGILCLALLLTAGVQLSVWKAFVPPDKVGSIVESTGTDLAQAGTNWVEQYLPQYQGWRVPYGYRLDSWRVRTVEVLNQAEGVIQVDYLVHPASDNDQFADAFGAAPYEEAGWYLAQDVLYLEGNGLGRFAVTACMAPVQYQIASDPTLQEDDSATEYLMADRDATYLFRDGALYVTYDHGQTLVPVPIPYDDMTETNNGLHNEYLPDNSYLVTPAFTAFVAYHDQGAYLIYSTDRGAHWAQSDIFAIDYRSERIFLSKTPGTCYVTLAVDRSLGSEYYATFCSTDLKTWTMLEGEAFHSRSYACVCFVEDNVGYLAPDSTDANGDCILYYTRDNGATCTTITLPQPTETVALLGYNPFVQVETIRLVNGKIQLIVGQGDMGDYSREGHLVKGLYESEDGVTFFFVEETFHNPVEVG